MRKMFIITTPRSRYEIKDYARKVRSDLGYGINDFVDATKLYDLMSINENCRDFDYQVIPDDSKVFSSSFDEAFTDVKSGKIYIKESVYIKASTAKYNRASFTMIHEFGHYLLHHQIDSNLYRRYKNINEKVYENVEWQANEFAEEFLMPDLGCLGLSQEEIRLKYHVSKGAAKCKYVKLRNKKS